MAATAVSGCAFRRFLIYVFLGDFALAAVVAVVTGDYQTAIAAAVLVGGLLAGVLVPAQAFLNWFQCADRNYSFEDLKHFQQRAGSRVGVYRGATAQASARLGRPYIGGRPSGIVASTGRVSRLPAQRLHSAERPRLRLGLSADVGLSVRHSAAPGGAGGVVGSAAHLVSTASGSQ